MTTKKTKAPDFESSLAQLESLVERMESGELALEESLKAFEEGVKLTRLCQETLSAAQQKVQLLMEKNGKATLQKSPVCISEQGSDDDQDEDNE